MVGNFLTIGQKDREYLRLLFLRIHQMFSYRCGSFPLQMNWKYYSIWTAEMLQ